MKRNKLFVILFFSFLTAILFYPFFLKGKIIFPSNYMTAWYEPWKTYNLVNGAITISHKPIASDIFRQLFPFKSLAMDMIRDGMAPLWNPYNGAGMPLLATMHVGYLNVFNVLFLFLPNILAWNLEVIIQPLLLALLMFTYCRTLKLSFFSSLFSSTILMLSGFVIVRSIFTDYDFAFAALIALLILIEHISQRKKAIFYLGIPPAVFFLFTVTQPQIISYVLLFTVAYTLFRLKLSKETLTIFFYMILGTALASIQLVPTFELYRKANVTASSSQFIIQRFLLPIEHYITFLIPNYFGNQATYNYWGNSDFIETIASIGIIPCLFAFSSLFDKKGKGYKIFFVLTLLLTLFLTLRWKGTELLYSLPVPVISTGIPARMLFLSTLSIATLAGFGLEEWIENKMKFKKEYFFFTVGVLFFAVGTFWFYKKGVSCSSIIVNCRLVALKNTLLEFSYLLISLIAAFVLKKSKLSKILPFLIIGIIIASGIYNAEKFLPFSDQSTLYPAIPLIKKMQTLSKNQRILGLGQASIGTDIATQLKLYDPNYYDPLYIKQYGQLVAYSADLKRSDVEIANDLHPDTASSQRRQRLLQLLSVGYIVYNNSENKNANNIVWSDKDWSIVKNNSLPRIYEVTNSEVLSRNQQALKKLFSTSFDPFSTVLLDEKLPLKNSRGALYYQTSKIKDTGNSLSFSLTSTEDAILIVTDNFYPGWEAFIDGKPTKIIKANYSFRAISAPKGNHVIKFTYDPFSFKLGSYISGVSLLLYLLLFLRSYKISHRKYDRNIG